METQHHPGNAPFSLRGLPPSFWYIVTVSTGLAIIVILAMVVLGYRDGLRRGEAQTRQQVAILLQRASDMLDAGMNVEARTVYERILEFDPQNEAARSALLAVEQIETPEVVPQEQAKPSPVDIEWSRALALFEEGRWREAIQRFTLVRSTQPDYKSEELNQRLFVSYVELARAAIADGGLEEAVQLFDKALELQPNDTLVREERFKTALYVDVKTYWGADWSRVIGLLVDLYRVDPEYKNVRNLLQRAHVEQGEVFAHSEEWCAAAASYTSAIAVLDWLDLRGRRDELTVLCRNSKGE